MKQSKLLVVDDDQDFATGLARLLELYGHKVSVVFTGKGAVEAVKKDRYLAVLMDIGLPDFNGIECLRKIRKFNPEIRCFLLTGYSAHHLAEQGMDAGAVEILTKPVDTERLSQKLFSVDAQAV